MPQYWLDKLSTPPSALALPYDHPETTQVNTKEKCVCSLSTAIIENIKSFTTKHNCSISNFLLSAFQTLLFRYSGQSDFIIGTFKQHQTFSCPDTLFRSLWNEELTFLTLLQNTGIQLKKDRQHPLPNWLPLLEKLSLNLNATRNPLFQVGFYTTNSSHNKLMMLCNYPISPSLLKLNFSLHVNFTKNTFDLFFQYNVALFDKATITRIVDNFRCLLKHILLTPKQPIERLNMLNPKEKLQLLDKWNNTDVDYDTETNIVSMFEKQVEMTPLNIAIIFKNTSISYEKLNQKTNQLARYLYGKVNKSEKFIIILFQRNIDMIISTLATLKLGLAYIPIAPNTPKQRIKYIFNHTQCKTAIVDNRSFNEIKNSSLFEANSNLNFIVSQQHREKVSIQIKANVDISIKANTLAYIIYTSGSTGKPKGVQVEHAGVVNLASTEKKIFNISHSNRILNFAPCSFDASVWEWYSSLLNGATLVLTDKQAILPGSPLLDTLKTFQIDIATIPPSIVDSTSKLESTGLKTLICAGEIFPSNIAKKYAKKLALFNAYGPTETTVCATIERVFSPKKKLNIGKPIANTKIYILDKFLQPTPIGVTGELHIGGIGLARGYLNNPTLTKERFIPNPFSTDPNSRIYKTGDLARWLPDGNIDYIGRIDNQVKIRGHRIELGEIEYQLCQHSAIKQCVALINDKHDKHIIAYYVSSNTPSTITPNELRKHLANILPSYMLPQRFIAIKEIPLTANGKTDVKHLATLDEEEKTSSLSFLSFPTNDKESIILRVFSELLHSESIDKQTNFFDLGIHSLMLLDACQLINKRANLTLEIVDLLAHPTIHALLTFIKQQDCKNQSTNLNKKVHAAKTRRHNSRARTRALVAA